MGSVSLDHSAYSGDNLASGETTVNAPGASTKFSSGVSSTSTPLSLSAPGVGKEGRVVVIYSAADWLKFDWKGSGDENPQGQAIFGGYRGHDRVIYWQEEFSN